MLAASLPGDSAVAYLKGKFAAIFGGQQQQQDAAGLSGPTSSPGTAPAAAPQLLALPRMRAWLGRSTAAAAALERYLGAQGIDLRGAVAAVAAAAAAGPKADASVPVALRSGLAARPTSGSGATPSQYPTVTPEAPVGPPGGSGGDPSWGWRWLVRCGVVALVTGDAPAVGPGLAETLLWDGERLHAAQNQFQQLLVVTAGGAPHREGAGQRAASGVDASLRLLLYSKGLCLRLKHVLATLLSPQAFCWCRSCGRLRRRQALRPPPAGAPSNGRRRAGGCWWWLPTPACGCRTSRRSSAPWPAWRGTRRRRSACGARSWCAAPLGYRSCVNHGRSTLGAQLTDGSWVLYSYSRTHTLAHEHTMYLAE